MCFGPGHETAFRVLFFGRRVGQEGLTLVTILPPRRSDPRSRSMTLERSYAALPHLSLSGPRTQNIEHEVLS